MVNLNISKRVKFNTSIDEKLLNELRDISDRYGITMSKLIEAGISHVISEIKESEKNKKSNASE